MDAQTYEKLQTHDEPSLDGDGDDGAGNSFRIAARLADRIRMLTRVCALLVGVVIVLLCAQVVFVFSPTALVHGVPSASSPPPWFSSSSSNADFGSAIGQAPKLPLVTRTFTSKVRIANDFDPYNAAIWEQDVPRGRGFVKLPDKDGADQVYSVSAVHQLHCLFMMQLAFAKALEDPAQVDKPHRMHMYHCAEYLRQSIRCAADPGLDPTFPVPDNPHNHATFGYGGTHVCRDYDSLFAWAEKHRVTNHTGVEGG